MSYDLFISYSRRDNEDARVAALVARIRQDYGAFAGEELRCFFDLTEIQAMDDWRHRILGGLRESNLLLLILSPNYLASPYCEWEIVEFLKYEHSRAVQGGGVTSVYFIEIPGLDEPGFERQAAEWVARVRRRNYVDLRPWHEEGEQALLRADVRARLSDLERSLHRRISRLRRIVDAPGNLPAHNPRFVGREAEMTRLHEAAGLGRYGLLTAVQGVGGMGKTALAIQYAYAYADFYPGGRWMIGCAGCSTLAAALRRLDVDLGIRFTDEEKADDVRAAKRVLAALDGRAEQGARARALEPNPPAPRALVILDNVDAPAILQPPQTDIVSGRKWLHVVATTRLPPEEFGEEAGRHCHLPVDELPLEDAVRLIESHQPGGVFPDESERAAAREIGRLLLGFTLAVEVVAVHLGERRGRTTCVALLERLRREGVDSIARKTRTALKDHAEKLVAATLAPTLENLLESERLVLGAAALLPPESVVLPWLRAVAVKTYPELGKHPGPGYDDPWWSLVNRLVGLRLLQIIDWNPGGWLPRLCRMHRLVQAVTKEHAAGTLPKISNILIEEVKGRASFLREGWVDLANRWEILPLSSFAAEALEVGSADGPWLADKATHCLRGVGDYAGAEPLCRRALEACVRVLGPEHPDTLDSVSNLGVLLYDRGDYAGAEPLYRRALEARERVLGPEHPDTLDSMSNLGVLLYSKGDYTAAEPLYRRAFEARGRVLGPEHAATLEAMNSLAGLLKRKGDYAGAEPLYWRALKARERVLGPEHPSTLTSVNDLALLLETKGNCLDAEPLCRRALEARVRVLGPEHPSTLTSVNNLASLLARKGDYAGSEQMLRRALESSERMLGPEHPNTLATVNNLAVLLQRKGDYVGAEQLFRQTLEARQQRLGADHPDTLRSINNLADLLTVTGRVEDALFLRRRALNGLEGKLGGEHPDFLRALNNSAYDLRKAGLGEEAEPFDRRCVAASLRALGEIHPLTIHRRNNLVQTLIMLGKLEEARQILAANWHLDTSPHINTTARIAFLRHVIALLESRPDTPFLGQLKTLLTGPEIPMASDVAIRWNIAYFIESLKPKLAEHNAEFLTAVVDTLNDRAKVPVLDGFPEWRNQPPVPLDAPWPD